ncbi:hypothetical protein GKC70_14635 [Pseudomonas sp. REB1044]|uniref:hypothetical protein n=1 Tax=Pseudomonas sp. REB1044 TaxID=2675224 RepID=UPI0033697FBB
MATSVGNGDVRDLALGDQLDRHLGARLRQALGNEGLKSCTIDAPAVRFVALADFLLADDLGSSSTGAAALVLKCLLGSLLGPAVGVLALLLRAMLGGDAICLGLLKGSALGGSLVDQLLLATCRCIALGLLFPGDPCGLVDLGLFDALALGLHGLLLSQTNAVLFGALFGLALQAGQLGLLGFELLAFLECCPQGGQHLVFGAARFCLEFLPVRAELHTFGFSNQPFELKGVQFAQVVGQCLQPVQAVVMAINPCILGGLPVIQRLAHFFLPGFENVPHPLAFSIDAARNLLLLCRQFLAFVFDGSFGARYLVGHRRDFLAAFDGLEVWHHGQELVDLHADLLKPRLEAFFSAVHRQSCFLRRSDDQFFFCGHANLPRQPCGGR